MFDKNLTLASIEKKKNERTNEQISYHKRAMMALDCSPDPYGTNEMVGNIWWSGVEQFW